MTIDWKKVTKDYRARHNLSRRELAEKLGVKPITVKSWELGIYEPREPNEALREWMQEVKAL